MKLEYLPLVVFFLVLGIGGIYLVMDFGLVYGHLGKEVKLCEETIQGSKGWNRSPYYYLRCSYEHSETTCTQISEEKTEIYQTVRAVEIINDTTTQLTTFEGLKFNTNEKVGLGDFVLIKKSWKAYSENYTQLTDLDTIQSYYKTFEHQKIILEPYYNYILEDFDYPKTTSTYERFTNYCEKATNESTKYDLIRVDEK